VIVPILSWWFLSTILALVALPFAWRLFSRLPDRGVGFIRAIGLLLCGYGYWIGASLQILPNSFGGITLVLLLLVALALYFTRRDGFAILRWLRSNLGIVLMTELIFTVAFVSWAWVRANNPEITGTEKPMELAFVNAILRSEGFPPRDPWMSGYAISYYYFGYVLLSMLTRLTGVSAGVGFNLGNSLWFALIAVGSYSLLYNLFNQAGAHKFRYLPALLGPLFTLISGNLGGFLELLHSRHIFWRVGANDVYQSSFWTWLGLENLENAPIGPPSWVPQRYLWWWRSSRVIRDLDLRGIPIGTQSIDEFPFFSFLLADNHPHLLALPVVLLALGFTMQVFFSPPEKDLGSKSPSFRIEDFRPWITPLIVVLIISALIQVLSSVGFERSTQEVLAGLLSRTILIFGLFLGGFVVFKVWQRRLPSSLDRGELIFGAWLFGALAFLNTWDFPIYLCVIALILFWQFRQFGVWGSVKAITPTLLWLLFMGILLYLPWYPTFASQAGGILPHFLQPTRFPHFLVMFGPSLLPISIWLLIHVIAHWKWADLRWLFGLTIGIPLILLLLSWSLAALILLNGAGGFSLESIYGTLGVASLDELIQATLRIRFAGSWTALYLGVMLASAVVILRRQWGAKEYAVTQVWVIFAIVIGALLILGPEFLYLRDQFGLRMNTIFKFYFAAWILWSTAAGYLLVDLWRKRNLRWLPVQAIAIIPLLMGLVYPVLSVWTKTQQFQPTYGRNLDGSMHPGYMSNEDRDAINWINAYLADGVIAEAIGGSYTYYTRVSTHTGFPTVLGWPGHEGQWRGGYLEQGSRQDDIRQLYQSSDWEITKGILDRYSIDYVFIGELERQTYPPVYDAKFDAYMDLIYANEKVKIYAREGVATS
jgi:uncharacterized membrane protein